MNVDKKIFILLKKDVAIRAYDQLFLTKTILPVLIFQPDEQIKYTFFVGKTKAIATILSFF